MKLQQELMLWTGHEFIEAASRWQGRGDGAQTGGGERLQNDFSYWELVGAPNKS
jgi:hypothetical protein